MTAPTINEVALTILNQLGGKRFIMMTGAKDFIADGDDLVFKIGRNESKANKVRIHLTGADLYDMTFTRETFSTKTLEWKKTEKAKSEGNYCDMLQTQFEKITGLYTSF